MNTTIENKKNNLIIKDMFGFRNKVKENKEEEVKEYKPTYSIREEQYNLSETRFYPEVTYNNYCSILSYGMHGFNYNGYNYCLSCDDALSIIEMYKNRVNNKLIKEIIHKIE